MRIFWAFVLVFVLFPFGLLAQTNVIYVIDTSGSMQTNRLYYNLLDQLESRFIPYLDEDDHVVLMTFDEAARKRFEFNASNQDEIREAIRQLRSEAPEGDWTNLTGAVHTASKEARELRKKKPEWEAEVYLFTDGKQDVPPDTPEPRNWNSTMSSEFSGWVRDDPDMNIYMVKLPGADLSGIPSDFIVTDMQDVRKGVLTFEKIFFEGKRIRIDLGREGNIPAEDQWANQEITLKVAQAIPKGEPKDVQFIGLNETRVDPGQARFNKRGNKQKLTLDFPVVKGRDKLTLVIDINHDASRFECDDRITVEIPVEFKEYKAPWWVRLWNWILGLPLWLLILIGLILLLWLICLLMPKFSKGAQIVSGDVAYRLRRKASLCGTTVVLGPSKGVPFGDGARKVAVIKAGYGGSVTIIPKAPDIEVNGLEIGNNKTKLGRFSTISWDGASADFNS